MSITEKLSLFGLLRQIDLSPEQVVKLQDDLVTRKYHPDILNGKIKPDGSATVKGHVLSEDIMYILDADVEGGVFN